MSIAVEQTVADVGAAPGELSLSFRAGSGSTRLWVRTETAVTPPGDAILPLVLMPAMRRGGRLRVEAEVGPRVLRNASEFGAVQAAWSRSWPFPAPPLREVEVEAAPRRASPRPPSGRVAAFFSGGVDSWATVLGEPELTDLIFIRGGVDIVPGLQPWQAGLAERVEPVLREVAAARGLTLHVVETNARELSEPLVPWGAYCGGPLAAIALFFEEAFDRVLISTSAEWVNQPRHGAARLVDELWSSERLEIVEAGNCDGRFERTRVLAADPDARRSLRVCWHNPDGIYNCGRCNKCVLTMMTLEALAAREHFETFPPQLDTEQFAAYTPTQGIEVASFAEALAEFRERGRDDLVAVIEPVVRRGEAALGDPGLAAAEQRAEAAEALLAELAGSRSWRLTEPLRLTAARARESVRRRRARRASASS